MTFTLDCVLEDVNLHKFDIFEIFKVSPMFFICSVVRQKINFRIVQENFITRNDIL